MELSDSFRGSLRAQLVRGIDGRRAAAGEPAGADRAGRGEKKGDRERAEVALERRRLELRRDYALERERRERSGDEADGGERGAFADQASDQPPRRRAERHPHAELA